MNLEDKINLCIQKKIELENACKDLLKTVKKELKDKSVNEMSSNMGRTKSYISKTLPRGIYIKKWPSNLKSILNVANALVKVNKKKKDLERI